MNFYLDLSARTPITSSSFNSSSDAPLCYGIEHSFSNDDDADEDDDDEDDDDEDDDDEDDNGDDDDGYHSFGHPHGRHGHYPAESVLLSR